MTCPTLETAAAWALDELAEPEGEAFEAHFFGCQRCFQQAQRMQQLLADFRSSLPPFLTVKRHKELEATRSSVPAVHVAPGEQATIRLGGSALVGIWVMHAALNDVERVDFEARGADGSLLFAVPDVPFDRERGQVLLACQIHYRALPMGPTLFGKLSARQGAETRVLGEYVLNHEFDSL
jgi:hypothetical protein